MWGVSVKALCGCRVDKVCYFVLVSVCMCGCVIYIAVIIYCTVGASLKERQRGVERGGTGGRRTR